MASFKEKVASVAVEQAVKYARKDFKRNAPRILNLVEKFDVKKVNRSTYAGLHKVMDDPNNNWMKFAEDLICNTDEHVLTKLVPPLMNVAINSYTKRMAAIEKYGCNVPWAILMDPTAACNLKCTGCWAAEYGHTSSLSYDDLARIIKEGKELGTYMYLYTGGEPTMRRKDLMRLCRENPDCAFLSFTNGTLIDDSFADEIKEVGNFYPAFSIEGYEEENDFRRGQGTFKKCTAAMQRLKDRGVPFGASLCYTSKNTDVLASDEYMDWLIERGVKFAWFFTYMPTGNGAVTDLMVSPEQRALMYKKMHEWRHTKSIFALDFWNDGEYVQGCIAPAVAIISISIQTVTVSLALSFTILMLILRNILFLKRCKVRSLWLTSVISLSQTICFVLALFLIIRALSARWLQKRVHIQQRCNILNRQTNSLIRLLPLLRLGRLRQMNSLTVTSILQSTLKMKICIIMKSRTRREFSGLKDKKIKN